MIRHIVFDMGQVLLQFSAGLFAERLHLSEEDAELIAWYRALGKARRELAPLRRGALCYTAAEGDVLAFTRTWEEDTVLCACNAGRECARVTLPWSAAEIGGLLCFPTDPDTGEAVVELPPLTGYLLRKSPGRE